MQHVLVTKRTDYPQAIDQVIRSALGAATTGTSTGPQGMTAHLTDEATPEQKELAQTILNAHNQLTVLTNKETITADGADTATITCSDAAIGADAAIDYAVWLDGVEYDSGSDTLATGTAELTLATNTAGTYLIEIRRHSGNYASGYVTVEALDGEAD